MKHILVVDDNKMNLEIVRRELADYQVTPVLSGMQALKFLERRIPDLILLDINMPQMDGKETLRRIKEKEAFRNIPVIFLTAENNPETEAECLELGAEDFIATPFIPKVMCRRIERVLELWELKKGLELELEQKTKQVERITSRSMKDALTCLYNRSFAQQMVDEYLNGGRKEACLFMIDADNFKYVNDNYGHISGDALLREMADILSEHVPEGGFAARVGGDEFMLFYPGRLERQQIAARAEALLEKTREHVRQLPYTQAVSFSIGISIAPEDGTSFETLYNNADKALYHVKRNGKNAYHFFSTGGEADEGTSTQADFNTLLQIMEGRRLCFPEGVLKVDTREFNSICEFLHRCVDRKQQLVQMVLLTLTDKMADAQPEVTVMPEAINMLEQAVTVSIRSADVSTRYSSCQLLVILVDTNKENGIMVVERIIASFKKLFPYERVRLTYDIEEMQPAAD